MHDIKWIRESPAAFDAAMKRRNLAVSSAEILSLDEAQRKQVHNFQTLEAERNAIAKSIGSLKAQGKHDEAESAMKRATEIKEEMAALKAAQEDDSLSPVFLALQGLPNVLADDVPDGADEAANVELRRWGTPTTLGFEAKDHVALGEGLGLMDFESAAKISGSRFVILTGALARMERALAQFMLDLHTQKHGYTEVNPPLLVRDNAVFGTGQLPKFSEDLFKTSNGYWLIPTSEVSLTNIVAGNILNEDSLPRRYTAHTPCFRSEAGAAGKDTRGMIRQHQFSKVELVSITRPEDSAAEHERMLGCAEEVLKQLELPYRVITLCSGDTGFCAQKTYDIEVWVPAQNTYREISSCSNTGAFQARRMNARYRPQGQDKGAEFVHTLNGSGVAVGRALIAVMENYQQADGTIRIPAVLRPYMGGLEVIV